MSVADFFKSGLEELFRLAEEELLGFPKFKIDGKPYDAVVNDASTDEIVIAGGNADAGGFSAILRRSEYGKPKKLACVQARGRNLSILSWKQGASETVLVCGQPASEDT